MATTKEKIIESAIKLFNQEGIANARLQHIADATGISVGNMAYHYRNKDAILEAVMGTVFKDLRQVFSLYRQDATLKDFNYQLDALFKFMTTYPFYLLDFSELQRNYPELHKKRRNFFDKMISQLNARFTYNEQRGIIKPMCNHLNYENLALSTWMLLEFWLPQQVARGKNIQCIGSFKLLIWSQITPHLTESGRQEFEELIVPTLTHHSN